MGVVYVQFTVTKEGLITGVHSLKDKTGNKKLVAIALRIIREMNDLEER